MKYVFFILLLACVIVAAIGQGKSKPTVIYKDGDRNKGIEKIVFKDEEGTTTREFDVQANNPYEKLKAENTTNGPNRSKRYRITKNQAATFFDTSFKEVPDQKLIATSHVWLKTDENSTAISYNLFVYSETGEEIGLRKSTLKVLDNGGHEIYSRDVETDSYGIQISPNGKYLGYGYGEKTHDIQPDQTGYKIIDISKGTEIVDIPFSYLKIAYLKYNFFILRGTKDSNFYTWIFNHKSAELFELEGVFQTKSPNSFEKDGASTIITDLAPYRIK